MTIEDEVLKDLTKDFDNKGKRALEKHSKKHVDSDNVKESTTDRAIKQYIDDCAPDFDSGFLK